MKNIHIAFVLLLSWGCSSPPPPAERTVEHKDYTFENSKGKSTDVAPNEPSDSDVSATASKDGAAESIATPNKADTKSDEKSKPSTVTASVRRELMSVNKAFKIARPKIRKIKRKSGRDNEHYSGYINYKKGRSRELLFFWVLKNGEDKYSFLFYENNDPATKKYVELTPELVDGAYPIKFSPEDEFPEYYIKVSGKRVSVANATWVVGTTKIGADVYSVTFVDISNNNAADTSDLLAVSSKPIAKAGEKFEHGVVRFQQFLIKNDEFYKADISCETPSITFKKYDGPFTLLKIEPNFIKSPQNMSLRIKRHGRTSADLLNLGGSFEKGVRVPTLKQQVLAYSLKADHEVLKFRTEWVGLPEDETKVISLPKPKLRLNAWIGKNKLNIRTSIAVNNYKDVRINRFTNGKINYVSPVVKAALKSKPDEVFYTKKTSYG